MGAIDIRISLREEWNFGAKAIEIKQFGFPGVVQVGSVVGDFIDPIDQLRFERRPQIKKILSQIRASSRRVVARMFDDSFSHFERQIESGELEIAMFKLFDDAQCVKIMVERAAMRLHQFVQFTFASVAERRVADVVDQSQSFGKFTIEAEGCGNGARNLRDFKGVGEAIAEMVGVARGENLGLGFQAAKGPRMDDAVPIASVLRAIGMARFAKAAAA